MKIAVIGFSGAGKSTLAKSLAELYKLPLLHLDTVHFLPGWEVREKEEKLSVVRQFLDENDSTGWVIDGNYRGLYYERRAEEADMIVFPDYNRFVCLKNAVKRYRRYKGSSRPDITEGCNEKPDRKFVWWILHKQRSQSKKAGYRQLEQRYGTKFVLLKNAKQTGIFLSAIAKRDKM